MAKFKIGDIVTPNNSPLVTYEIQGIVCNDYIVKTHYFIYPSNLNNTCTYRFSLIDQICSLSTAKVEAKAPYTCEWTRYTGLMDSFDYCIHCDKKRR